MSKSPSLEQQVQQLVAGASDPQTHWAVQITGAVLQSIAEQLAHLHYWIVTSKEGYWQSVHLSNLHAPEQEKTVVYAFADLTSANIDRLQAGQADQLVCTEVAVIEILFRLLGLREIESVVFFDQSLIVDKGKEIKRSHLEKLCREQLEKYRSQLC
jgi:hypothetical protein